MCVMNTFEDVVITYYTLSHFSVPRCTHLVYIIIMCICACLQEERAKHSKTSSALAAEKENKECLQAELNVLRKQLEREKDTFERA